MTPRQIAFIRSKLDGLSNRDAVIAAGYSPAGAKQRGTSLMKHPAVQAQLRARGFDFESSNWNRATLARSSAGRGLAVSPSMPKKSYKSAVKFLTDAMNCEDLPISMRLSFAAALLPYQHKKIGR